MRSCSSCSRKLAVAGPEAVEDALALDHEDWVQRPLAVRPQDGHLLAGEILPLSRRASLACDQHLLVVAVRDALHLPQGHAELAHAVAKRLEERLRAREREAPEPRLLVEHRGEHPLAAGGLAVGAIRRVALDLSDAPDRARDDENSQREQQARA